MKREGWQHGAVRNTAKPIGAAAVASSGGFAKAPSRPNNHSKFSGKCRRPRCSQCHSHPVTKSRDKAKGSYKLRSGDVVLNHRLLSWRMAAADKDRSVHWSKYSGISATGILDVLLTDSCCSQESDDLGDRDVVVGYDYSDGSIMPGSEIQPPPPEEEEEEEEEEEGDAAAAAAGDDEEEITEGSDTNGIEEDEGDDEDDDDVSEFLDFCEVGFVFEYMDDDEDWCIVDEMM